MGELRAADLPPAIDRAYAWAGGLLLVALCLPVTGELGRPVFLLELLDTPGGLLVVGAHLGAGVTLLACAHARMLPRTKALLGGAAMALLVVSLTLHEDTRSTLLPFLPHPLKRGAPFFLVSLLLASAASRHAARFDGPARARILAAAAALSALALFLWPHAGGGLTDLIVRALRLSAEHDTAPRAEAVLRTSLLSASLPAWLVLAAAAGCVSARVRPVPPAWLVALPVGLVALLGLKAGLALQAGGPLCFGLRAASMLAAVLMASTAALELAPPRLTRGLALALPACAALLVLGAAPRARDAAPWALGEAPPWAEELYARDLPALVDQAWSSPRRRELRERVHVLAARAASLPELASAIQGFGQALEPRLPDRRTLARAADRLNEAARKSSLPFYADASVVPWPDGQGKERPAVLLLCYRLRKVESVSQGGRTVQALWLERVDQVAVEESRLGWRRVGESRAMILLDAVQSHAEALEEQLGVTLDRQALARAVEAHELQHVIDGDRVRPPLELHRRLAAQDEDTITTAAGELSAYLAELSRAADPRATLADCARMAEEQPESADGAAAALALEAAGALDAQGRLQAVEVQLMRRRARAAHQRWFGGRLAGEPDWAAKLAADTREQAAGARAGLEPAPAVQ